jgi:hypothetical protein
MNTCQGQTFKLPVSDTKIQLFVWVNTLEVGGPEAATCANVTFGLGCSSKCLFCASGNQKHSSMWIFCIAFLYLNICASRNRIHFMVKFLSLASCTCSVVELHFTY